MTSSIAYRSSGLHHRRDARRSECLESVSEGEEGVRRGGTALRRVAGFVDRDVGRHDARLLTGPDADGHPLMGDDDGVRRGARAHAPRHGQVLELSRAGLAPRSRTRHCARGVTNSSAFCTRAVSPKVRIERPSGSGRGALKSRVDLRRAYSVTTASSEKPTGDDHVSLGTGRDQRRPTRRRRLPPRR